MTWMRSGGRLGYINSCISHALERPRDGAISSYVCNTILRIVTNLCTTSKEFTLVHHIGNLKLACAMAIDREDPKTRTMLG